MKQVRGQPRLQESRPLRGRVDGRGGRASRGEAVRVRRRVSRGERAGRHLRGHQEPGPIRIGRVRTYVVRISSKKKKKHGKEYLASLALLSRRSQEACVLKFIQ